MQKIQCPICHQEGVLQWKETVTIIKAKRYSYKKLYVYHQHPKEHPNKPKWCYLSKEQVKSITQKESTITQNNTNTENLNSSSNKQNNQESSWAGSLARLGHPLDVRKVTGSNPVRPTMCFCVVRLCKKVY